MSVYIKGIEMPTNCSECAFCGYYGNGEHMCDIIQKAVEYESAKMSRLDDCPLVHIPEHGRLIDADKIGLTDFEIILCQKGNPFKNALEMLLEKIENAPTIIPADKEEEG